MRTLLLGMAFLGISTSADAQRISRPRDRIPPQELAAHGDKTLTEIIEQTRPHFFQPDHTRIDFGLQSPWRVLVYIGSQVVGDSSVLRTYKASQVQEIRYYRPNEANTRLGSDNASVIQLTLKRPSRKS